MAQALQGPSVSVSDGPLRPYSGSKTIANATGGVTISPPCRAVRVGTAGSLSVVYDTGMVDVISMSSGETLPLGIRSIDSASTAAAITVFW